LDAAAFNSGMACSLLEDNALDEEGEYAEGLQV